MKKENLVTLKSALTATKGNTVFKLNNFYRCIKDGKGYLIYGEWFTQKEYDSLFELAHDRLLRDFKGLGILPENNKPISKSLFTKLADIHTYGTGRKALKVWYLRNTRECIYGFYPMQDIQVENQKECYQMYLDTINGNMEHIDNGDICFGNYGIPLSYRGLRIS